MKQKIIPGIESIAGDMKVVAENIVKEQHDLYLPLEKRNIIILTPETSIAQAYIRLFGSGKSYNNSTTFVNDCAKRDVYDGLNENNPTVLITALRLPIDISGKFSKVEWENHEGISLAKRIREGMREFQRDIPILFYSITNGHNTREEIEQIGGVVAYIDKPCSLNLKDNLTGLLYSAADRMFEKKYKNLVHSEAALHEAIQMIKK